MKDSGRGRNKTLNRGPDLPRLPQDNRGSSREEEKGKGKRGQLLTLDISVPRSRASRVKS
jgi:hypothetical protein